MPEVSRFFGIVISMYKKDHPRPHFHARYASSHGRFQIESGAYTGSLPPRVRRLVLRWLELHREELMINWSRLEQGIELFRIESLE